MITNVSLFVLNLSTVKGIVITYLFIYVASTLQEARRLVITVFTLPDKRKFPDSSAIFLHYLHIMRFRP